MMAEKSPGTASARHEGQRNTDNACAAQRLGYAEAHKAGTVGAAYARFVAGVREEHIEGRPRTVVVRFAATVLQNRAPSPPVFHAHVCRPTAVGVHAV